MSEKTVVETQDELLRQLGSYERELKKKLLSFEIDVEEALELYLAKRDEIEDQIEKARRIDGKYRVKLFDDYLQGYREIQAGVVRRVRLDLPKLTNQELLAECSKDLRTVSREIEGLTRWLHRSGGAGREERIQARYNQAMTRLLSVLARQNQVVINVIQEQSGESFTQGTSPTLKWKKLDEPEASTKKGGT